MVTISLDEYLKEQLKDEEFKKEWDALEEEYTRISNSVITNDEDKNSNH